MSCDFAIFDPSAAPRDAKAFRRWYYQQTDWDDDAVDVHPTILSPPLLQWYDRMSARFPNSNLSGSDDPEAIDYCFNRNLMYCSMPATKAADEAWATAKSIAAEMHLGTYDCMSDDGRNNRAVVFPEGPLENEPSFFSKLFGRTKG